MANAIVRAKQEDQPKPLAVGAPVCSTSAHAGGAVTAVTAVTACPRPVPAGAGRALPAAWPAQCARGCTVRACSPTMPILHITFVFCPRSGTAACPQLPSIPPGASMVTRVRLHPPAGFAVPVLLLSLPRPCRAITVLLSLLPPCLACRHA